MTSSQNLDRKLCALVHDSFARFRATGDPRALAAVFDGCASELLRVAVHLVRDVDVAEDLVQATFVAAIEDAASWDPRRPLLPWLVGILGHRAKVARRAAARTIDPARLPAGSGPQASSPERAAERAELDAAVERAIAGLPEPYRPVLQLSLRHGLSAADIALALERPPATVRSQIARGMELVRRALPMGITGGALLTLGSGRGLAAMRAAVLAKASEAASLAPLSLAVSGVLAMKKATLGVLVLLLALGCAWISGFFDARAAAPLDTVKGVLEDAAGGSAGQGSAASRAAPGERAAAANGTPAVTEARAERAYPRDPERGRMIGFVVDEGWSAAPGVRVRVRPSRPNVLEGLEIPDDRASVAGVERQVTTAADGSFEVDDLATGPYRVDARAAGRRRASARWSVGSGSAERPLLLQLANVEPRRKLTVKTVDMHGEAVPNAKVEVFGIVSGRVAGKADEPPLRGTSDAGGICTFDTWVGRAIVRATEADRGRAGIAVKDDAADSVRVELAAAGRLEVVLSGAPAAELAGATVDAHALTTTHNAYYWTYGIVIPGELDGSRATFRSLPAGTYNITLHSPRGWRLKLAPGDPSFDGGNSLVPAIAKVTAGATERIALELIRGGGIEGTIRDEGARPVPGARVRATFAPRSSNYTDGCVLHGAHVWRLDSDQRFAGRHPATHFEVVSDAKGAYRFTGLPAGNLRVEVLAQGLSYDRREGVAVGPDTVTRLEHTLAPAGVLQGAVTPSISYVGVVRKGAESPEMLAILRDGEFTFPGLRAGTYVIGAFHSTPSEGWRPLGEATVVAGRTTWIDLRDAEHPVEISGVVLSSRGPVAGAWVGIGRANERTAADGSFRIPCVFPISVRWARLSVRTHGLEHRLPLPDAVAGAKRWHGTFRLGDHALVLRALDAHGGPARVRVELRGGEDGLMPGSGKASVSGTCDSDDAGILTANDLPPGNYSIEVKFPSGYVARPNLELPRGAELVVREPPTATLNVRVVDAAGDGIARVYVYAYTWRGDGPPPEDARAFAAGADHIHGKTDAFGRVALESLTAGEVLLRAWPAGFGAPSWVKDMRLSVVAGERRTVTLARDP